MTAFRDVVTDNPYYIQYPEFYPDYIAPAKINDLSSKVDGNKVILSWTAPGDDGDVGKVQYYILKYRTMKSEDGIDFTKEPYRLWSRYETKDVEGEPEPQPTGTKQNIELELPMGDYYFGIQSVDDALYNSPISNIVEAQIKDIN